MVYLFSILVILLYVFVRKFRYSKRKIQVLASIEKITLCTMGEDFIIPEVFVEYKYYFKGGVYYGKGYLLLSEILDSDEYLVQFNQDFMPVLQFQDKFIISEEHIEAFLLSKHNFVKIYIDPIEPFNSEIEGVEEEQITLRYS